MKINDRSELSQSANLIDVASYRRMDLHRIFRGRLNNKVDARYESRESKNQFVAKEIEKLAVKTVLNIGSGVSRDLKRALPESISLFEIDRVQGMDAQIDLDKISELPFDSNSFDLCSAFDVLEHLENFHLINSELYRISRKYVLIALPNSPAEIVTSVLRNRQIDDLSLNYGTFSKYYGLPLEPPQDRHKWWLYFQDIVRFYYLFSQLNGCELEFWTRKRRIKGRLAKMILGERISNTFLVPYVWIKLTKPMTTVPTNFPHSDLGRD